MSASIWDSFIFNRGWGAWVFWGWIVFAIVVGFGLTIVVNFLNLISGDRRWGDWVDDELGIHRWG